MNTPVYITNVTAHGLKGGDFSIDLDRANAIYGDNFKGKTRILDAVRVGLIGYLPELGKQARATMGLASGRKMDVVLTFNTGEKIVRTFWWEGDTVKQRHEVPERFKDNPLLAVMLNAEEYFALGPIERTRYVFANCSVMIMTREEMIARIKAASPEYDFAQVLTAHDLEALDAAADLNPMTTQQSMEWIIKFVSDHWTNLKNAADIEQKTILGITGQRADEEAGIPLATLEDQRAALQREITAINERKARTYGSFTQMKADQRRREEIAREVGFGEKSRMQLIDLRAKAALLEQTIAGFVVIPQNQILDQLSACADLDAQARQHGTNKSSAFSARTQAERELAALDGQTSCPYCGATGESWKSLKAAELTTAIDAHKETEAAAQVAFETARTAAQAKRLDVDNLRAENTRQADIVNQRAQCLAAIARLEPSFTRLETLKEEAAKLLPDDPALTAQVETVQTELNVKNDEARGLDVLITKASARAGDLVRMAEAEKKRDEANKLKEACALAGKELRAVQAEMVAGAFKPMLDTANAIFRNVLPFVLEYRDGEIGARVDGVWRGHRTMSGVERLLTYAAIQAALTAASPVRVMLLDEMGRATQKVGREVAAALGSTLQAGHIDQVIVVDPERPQLYTDLASTEDLAFKSIPVV